MDKPRIRMQIIFDAGHVYKYWICDDGKCKGIGRSPNGAYLSWQLKVKYG